MFTDHYQILGVNFGASETEIRKAFKAKAMLLHPDKNPDPMAAEQFRQLTFSFELLSDMDARYIYDHQWKKHHKKREKLTRETYTKSNDEKLFHPEAFDVLEAAIERRKAPKNYWQRLLLWWMKKMH